MSKMCKCGNDISSRNIIHETEYSGWGWFLFTVLGLSAKPRAVRFICSKCREDLETTDDPTILTKYIGR